MCTAGREAGIHDSIAGRDNVIGLCLNYLRSFQSVPRREARKMNTKEQGFDFFNRTMNRDFANLK